MRQALRLSVRLSSFSDFESDKLCKPGLLNLKLLLFPCQGLPHFIDDASEVFVLIVLFLDCCHFLPELALCVKELRKFIRINFSRTVYVKFVKQVVEIIDRDVVANVSPPVPNSFRLTEPPPSLSHFLNRSHGVFLKPKSARMPRIWLAIGPRPVSALMMIFGFGRQHL